jgi:D-amino-acid dehydrogenase
VKVLILGAGVAGVTAAWHFWRDGHEVTVLERNPGVALETSFANGGQLSYSYVAPLASPSVIPKIPPWLLRRDSPLRFRPSSIPTSGAGASRSSPRAIARRRIGRPSACCASPSTAAT